MSWDAAGKWYDQCVGKEGHYYHQSLILPNMIRLLKLKPQESLLDLGCGQGVLQRSIPKTCQYVGVDASKELLAAAKKISQGDFIFADACQNLPIEKKDFDAACFLLSLQNMEHPDKAIAIASSHLKKGGRLLLVLNHPCFRIPRQSDWGFDERSKLQYRRMNVYMTPQRIPIQTNPGRAEKSATTYSFHQPLSNYISFLTKNSLVITSMEEWCSDKKSEGARSKIEDRARLEFPLFLSILSEKI